MNFQKRAVGNFLICLLIFSSATGFVFGAKESEAIKDKFAISKEEEKTAGPSLFGLITKKKITIENLPADTSPKFSVAEIMITGNTLIATETLFEKMPLLFDAYEVKPTERKEMAYYDFRLLSEVINEQKRRDISARTIEGFVQYILGQYQKKGYGGIHVFVPEGSIVDGKELPDGVLTIRVMEAHIASVSVLHYDTSNQQAETGYLEGSIVQRWSPVKESEVISRKKLDEFVNLLNLNPDRYVSAVISKGNEPESLAVNYRVYERNPWHWFAMVDNSGTKDRQWTPKFGLINTSLLDFDDRLTAVYQVPLESDWDENYAIFGSYDFPLMGPKLRLNLYAGYNEFDVNSAGDFNFLGRGQFYGGIFRYNVMQASGWFVDVLGELAYKESRVTNLVLDTLNLGTDLWMALWGWGVDIHRRDDLTDTSFTMMRTDSFDGSENSEFQNARNSATNNFSIYTTSARHSQYLDRDRVSRANASVKWITSDERLVPATMTAFGGMYTVRGYDEYEIVTDGGILASAQYEFDLVRYNRLQEGIIDQRLQDTGEIQLRKLAPLVFFDYGLAKIEAPLATEHRDRELASWGAGIQADIGKNFTGSVYYGYPLIPTDNTRSCKGRVHVGFLMRW